VVRGCGPRKSGVEWIGRGRVIVGRTVGGPSFGLRDARAQRELKTPELRAELDRWMKDQGDPGSALDTQKMYNANRNMGRKKKGKRRG